MIKIDIKTELNNIDKFFDNLSTSELEEMLIRNGAEDDRYKSVFDNMTDKEFEWILNKYGFKYRKVEPGKGGLEMNYDFKKVEDRINNLTDKEFYKLAIDSGLEKCSYEEKNKIYHQCECGNTNIDIFSVSEVLHHAQGMDIPSVDINYICPDCGSMMTESAYLYKRSEK